MFITDTHRGQIRQHLNLMEKQFTVLHNLAERTNAEEFKADLVLQAAAERALHIGVETLTDIGNIMIDALVMRDAASYEDIFEILTDEKVFEKEFAEHFMGAVRFRKLLAHEYLKLDAEQVWDAVQKYHGDFATIRDSIAKYVNL
jgi:uncharacterized protein YutE (UPF0331/DUF86 family)